MNISNLSATPFAVQKAFEQNINKHLNGHENSILRKCSYLNQINTTVQLCHIAYEAEDFNAAIDKVVERIKKLVKKEEISYDHFSHFSNSSEREDSLCDTFDKLPKPYQVAAVYSFYFLTNFMNDKNENSSEDWIDVFMSKYQEKEESELKDLVFALKGSDLAASVDSYYRNDEAVYRLKTLWNSDLVKGENVDKQKMMEYFRLTGLLEYHSVCKSFRKFDKSAAINEFKNTHPSIELITSRDDFDILSDNIVCPVCDNMGDLVHSTIDILSEPFDELTFVAASARHSADVAISEIIKSRKELNEIADSVFVDVDVSPSQHSSEFYKELVDTFEKRDINDILMDYVKNVSQELIDIYKEAYKQETYICLCEHCSEDIDKELSEAKELPEKMIELAKRYGIGLDLDEYNKTLSIFETALKKRSALKAVEKKIKQLKKEIHSGKYSEEAFWYCTTSFEKRDRLEGLVTDFENIKKENKKLGSNAISIIDIEVTVKKWKDREEVMEKGRQLEKEIESGKYSEERFNECTTFSEIRDKLEELVTDFENIKKENKKLGSIKARFFSLNIAVENRKKGLEDEIKDVQMMVQGLEEYLEELEKVIIKNEDKDQEIVEEVETAKKDFDDISPEINKSIENEDEIQQSVKELEAMRKDFDDLSSEINEIMVRFKDSKNDEDNEIFASLKRMQKKIKNIKEIAEKEIEKLRNKVAKLEEQFRKESSELDKKFENNGAFAESQINKPETNEAINKKIGEDDYNLQDLKNKGAEIKEKLGSEHGYNKKIDALEEKWNEFRKKLIKELQDRIENHKGFFEKKIEESDSKSEEGNGTVEHKEENSSQQETPKKEETEEDEHKGDVTKSSNGSKDSQNESNNDDKE